MTWSVLEGATGGTITAAGFYTAPDHLGTYHVVASSTTDRSKTVTATVQVVKSGFTVAGAIQRSRLGPNATMLPNGKVLIAGGGWGNNFWDGLFSVPESELFDPSAGTLTIAGTTSRTFATATLLSDGNVLLTDGQYGWTGDPGTGKIANTARASLCDLPAVLTDIRFGCRAVSAGGQHRHLVQALDHLGLERLCRWERATQSPYHRLAKFSMVLTRRTHWHRHCQSPDLQFGARGAPTCKGSSLPPATSTLPLVNRVDVNEATCHELRVATRRISPSLTQGNRTIRPRTCRYSEQLARR